MISASHFRACCLLLSALALGGTVRAEDPPPLKTAAEIRALSRAEAEQGLHVKIRGTVVLQIGSVRVFTIHDGEECVTVHFFKSLELGFWKGPIPSAETMPGSVLEVEGITGPAGYVPVIIPTTIRRIGSAPLPPPRKPSMERLVSGCEASQYVELEGVVQNARKLSAGFEIGMMVEGIHCDVKVQREADLVPSRLVDARVRIRGCSSPIFNLRSEATGMRLLAQDARSVTILEPPPKNPFLAPRVPLKGLLPFSTTPDRFHRKVTEGVVNFVLPGKFFFLQQGSAGVRVDSPGANVSVGDEVEVAGFVDTSRHIASLTEAVARRKGSAALPKPIAISTRLLMNPPILNPLEPVTKLDHFGSLVRLVGTIRNFDRDEANHQVRMLVESDGVLFNALLQDLGHPPHTAWAEGAEIAITGVSELEFEPGVQGSKSPVITGFTLWSRDPADVVVLRAPSWWTPLHLSLALGGSLAVLALSLIWASALRRQVKLQMAVIGSKLHNEAVSEERNRIARDLHDTLEQQLAGVSLQLDDIQETVREDPRAAQDALDLARRMLDFTRTEARRSVWDLRSQVLELHGLETAVRAMAESSAHPSGPNIKVSVSGEPRRLPAADAYNLLRMCQESLANALKHAHASHIHITLEYPPDKVRLTVSDDGQGFAPGMLEHSENPHFGVLGMRERARKIGATLMIDGKPGGGCTVSIVLPSKA